MVRLLCLQLTLLLSLGSAVGFSSLSAAEKPNILFIAIDDQNDWIGCLDGHPQIKTPHIDALAKRGTVFLNAHCQSPLCNSSRTSLMTGLRPSTTGIYGLAPWFRDVDQFKSVVSLPQYLSKQGYTTYTTGKIYHGGNGRRAKDSEWDHIGTPAAVGAKPPSKLVKTPAPHPLVDWGTFPHKDEDKGDWKVASWAVEQLDKKPKEPFFLTCGFFLPHVPCYATQKWFDLYPEEKLILPPYLAGDRDDTPRFSWYLHWKLPEPRKEFLDDAKEWKNLVRSYLACTSFVDSQVGRVLDALDRNGLKENTIVVLWSDHGWHLGEKDITGKNTLWDRSTRVPLIFAGPGVITDAKCTRPAELLDMYPTLLELCGLPENKKLEGLSLVPQLRDANASRERPAITTHNHDNHGVRSEDYRYITYADGTQELYDMRADPNEWKNLADDPKMATVIQQMKKWLPKVNAQPAPGSKHRILTRDTDGNVIWEGKDVGSDDPIPEITNSPTKNAASLDDPASVLIVGAKPDHPHGTHMYELEGKLLANCVSKHDAAKAQFVAEWPPSHEQLQDADSIVFYSNPAGSVLLKPEHRESFDNRMQGNTGFVAIHWGTGVGYDRVSEPKVHRDMYKSWLGGWFRRPPCDITIGESKLRLVAEGHEIGRGWKEFVIRDEFYLNPVLHDDAQPLLTVNVGGKDNVVGWTHERKGQGRSVGITLGHFHDNFTRNNFRRLLVNAILWSAHVEVPNAGADVEVNVELLELSDK